MWKILAIFSLALSICAATAIAQDGQKKKEGPAKQRQSAEDVFKTKDTDHDGKLTLKEFIGDAKSDSDSAKQLEARFKAIDTNGHGYITLDELKAAWAKHAQGAGRQHGKRPPQNEKTTS